MYIFGIIITDDKYRYQVQTLSYKNKIITNKIEVNHY